MTKRLTRSQRTALLDALYAECGRLRATGISFKEMDEALRQFRADWLAAQQQSITLLCCAPCATVEAAAQAEQPGEQGARQASVPLSQYWHLPQAQREQARHTVRAQDLEAYAVEHKLLVFQGTLTTPQGYPCACQLQDPTLCYEDQPERSWTKPEREEGQCACPCHRYCEVW